MVQPKGPGDVFFPLSEWVPAFLLTVAVEAPIVGILLRQAEPSLWRLAVLFLFANLATHLAVWYVLTQLIAAPIPFVAIAEAWAIGGEAVLYVAAIRGLSPGRAIAATVIANLASFLAGRVVFAIWPDLLV